MLRIPPPQHGRHLVETFPWIKDADLIETLDQHRAAGWEVLAIGFSADGVTRIVYAPAPPDPLLVELMRVIPMRVADMSADFTDEAKARWFDRAQAIIYRGRA